jgi:hypothetical protein
MSGTGSSGPGGGVNVSAPDPGRPSPAHGPGGPGGPASAGGAARPDDGRAGAGAGAGPGAQPVRQRVVWRPDQVVVQHDIPGLSDLRDDTSAGRLLLRSLVRAQLGLSLMCLTFALTVTASFPLIAALLPAVARFAVDGVPLTLIVLGLAFYPVFLAVGWFYNRHARQLEMRFTHLVDPASRRPDA